MGPLNNAEDDAISIELHGVSRRYPGAARAAVQDVSLRVHEGEILALLGPSGCGKTTTLRMIAGFERADAGSVSIGGVVMDDGKTFVQPEKRGVGMVFQDYALFPHLNVVQNVGFGLTKLSKYERDARVLDLLDLAGLTELARRYPHQLSGGQQQRVALARALAPKPRVLLLDEPFSNLDTELRLQMRGEVRELLKVVGTTAILVTHDQQEAMTVADRMAVMLHGHIEQVDTPEAVYHYPATRAVASFVGQGTFIPARIAGAFAESDLGSFEIDAVSDALRPEQVDLLLRPRDVSLDVDPDGIAVIQSRVFNGAEFTYRIQLPCGVTLQSNQPLHVDISPGTRVKVRCNRNRVAAYDADSRIALTSAPRIIPPILIGAPPTAYSVSAAAQD